jgi:hypothetical protein
MLNVINTRFGRIEGLFQCKFQTGGTDYVHDVMLIQGFGMSKWKPPTHWPGMVVVKPTTVRFISPDYVVRGAVLPDTDLEGLTGKHYFLDDNIDGDMTVRMMNGL